MPLRSSSFSASSSIIVCPISKAFLVLFTVLQANPNFSHNNTKRTDLFLSLHPKCLQVNVNCCVCLCPNWSSTEVQHLHLSIKCLRSVYKPKEPKLACILHFNLLPFLSITQCCLKKYFVLAFLLPALINFWYYYHHHSWFFFNSTFTRFD